MNNKYAHANDLRIRNVIRMFKLGEGADEFSILTTEDYTDCIKKLITKENKSSIYKFLHCVLPKCTDVSINRETLFDKIGLSEQDLTYLMSIGTLTIRDVDSWWIAIPNAGQFMKHFIRGRECVIKILKKRKYKEILEQDLQKHSSLKSCCLGASFCIHDVIGKEIVK
ncbi:Serine/threonine-protein kinase 19 [Trichoplax sp. H2]|nr:Serine/threonine-protein kinase 19 [Trichoplax sp. H2]|eukprot:RDD43913.1 Serine/threonine-protein kinase 19 [Trichoplax sp. H2]